MRYCTVADLKKALMDDPMSSRDRFQSALQADYESRWVYIYCQLRLATLDAPGMFDEIIHKRIKTCAAHLYMLEIDWTYYGVTRPSMADVDTELAAAAVEMAGAVHRNDHEVIRKFFAARLVRAINWCKSLAAKQGG